MRSLYMLVLLTFALGCQTIGQIGTGYPYSTQKKLDKKKKVLFGPSEEVLTGDGARPKLPYGESETETIGNIILSDPKTYRSPVADNIILGHQPVIMEKDVASALEKVADRLPDGYGIFVIQAYRPLKQQDKLIEESCKSPVKNRNCIPKVTYPKTCIPVLGKRNSCPHTSGRAVDVWAIKKTSSDEWQQCISQKECMMAQYPIENSIKACFNNSGQKILIKIMKQHGFCVDKKQPWHFEKSKLSKDCFF